jgi:hypothetical protein
MDKGVSETTHTQVGSFMAISGQKPWPSTGCFVTAYGQFFMAADRWIRCDLTSLDRPL